jgi:hypothetical protein
MFVLVVMVCAACIFFTLLFCGLQRGLRKIITYAIQDGALNIYVGPVKARSIKISRISSIRQVTFRETLGLRMQFSRMRFGNRIAGPAIDVAVRDGIGVIISPDDPEKFIAAIQAARGTYV